MAIHGCSSCILSLVLSVFRYAFCVGILVSGRMFNSRVLDVKTLTDLKGQAVKGERLTVAACKADF